MTNHITVLKWNKLQRPVFKFWKQTALITLGLERIAEKKTQFSHQD